MKKTLALVSLLAMTLSFAAPVRAQSAGHALDGTHWKVKTSFWRKLMFWRHHGFKFEDGQFILHKGKMKAPYTADTVEGKTHWKAELTTDKNVKLAWVGTVEGDVMTGTMTKTDKDGKSKSHAFTAVKRVPKKKT